MKITTGIIILLAFVVSGCRTAPPEPGSLLFQDDFSSPKSGWDLGQDERGGVRVSGGKLSFAIPGKDTTLVSTVGLDFEDAAVSVEVLKTTGADDNTFGIICRYQDRNNFYFFQASSDGYYGIGKVIEGQATLINASMMQTTTAINQGTAFNYLQAICHGSTLSFTVNGEALASVEDADLSGGDVGLIAGTISSSEVEIVFDNFQVLQP